MPIMGGVECTKKIREMERGRRKKIIFGMCSNLTPKLEHQLLNIGFSACLKKPLNYQTLIHALGIQKNTLTV